MSWPSQPAWGVLKDIILTAGGLAIIAPQAIAAHPNVDLLITGLAMCGLGASFHIGALMGGHIGSPPSERPRQESRQRPGD